MTTPLLLPGLERVGEDLLAGRAFFQGQNGAAVVVVNHRDVEPAPFLEQLDVAVLVGLRVRQAYQIEAGRDLDREAGERDPARSLGLFHQEAGDVGEAPAGKSAGSLNMISTVWVAGSPLSVLRRSDQVIASLRSGTSTSARMASSGGCPGPGVMVSVRQMAEPTKRLPLGSAGSSS